MLKKDNTLILIQEGNEVHAFSCSKRQGQMHISHQHVFKVVVYSFENLCAMAKEIKNIFPQNIHFNKVQLYLNLDNLIIKKWELPFFSRKTAYNALTHLLRREIPVEANKLEHKYLFLPKKIKKPRLIFSFTMQKALLERWTEAFAKESFSFSTISFSPFLLADSIKENSILLAFQEKDGILFMEKQNRKLNYLVFIPFSSQSSQNIAKQCLNGFDIYLAQSLKSVKRICFVGDRNIFNVVLSELQEKCQIPVLYFDEMCLNGANFAIKAWPFLGKLKSSMRKILSQKQALFSQVKAGSLSPHMDFKTQEILRLALNSSIFSPSFPNFATKSSVGYGTKSREYSLRLLVTSSMCLVSTLFVLFLGAFVLCKEINILNDDADNYKQKTATLFRKVSPSGSQNRTMYQMKSIIEEKIRSSTVSSDTKNMQALYILESIHNVNLLNLNLELDDYSYSERAISLRGNINDYPVLNAFTQKLKEIMPENTIEILHATNNQQNTVSFEIRITTD